MDSLQLYFVTGAIPELLVTIQTAVGGGVTMVQLRFKDVDDQSVLDLAKPVVVFCHRVGVPIIINDRIDLALLLGADGVHLGVDDLPLEAARMLAPEDFLIGYSPETDDQIQSAAERGATYLGIGPVFATSTKLDAGEPLGLLEFQRRRELTSLPVVGIGGIEPSNAGSIMRSGATGVAVSSAILRAKDVRHAAETLSAAIAQ